MAIDPSASVHPGAIVEDGAEIGPDCRIGPFCVIGAEVTLGAGCVLQSHVVIGGITRLGAGCTVFPFAALGLAPQDLKYRGERSELVIGDRTTIREYATMSPGTEGGGGVTRIGAGGLFMMHTHVGHDCLVGDGVILSNCATLAGHCVVGDGAILGGLAAVHQFVRIGRGAMIGGMSPVVADVIPYGLVTGERAHLAGLNVVGLKRRNTDRAAVADLRAAYDALFEGEGTLAERAAVVAERHPDNPLVAEVVRFVTEGRARALTLPAA
jgi:UDP-N-acetylglucosamine acyltransferase